MADHWLGHAQDKEHWRDTQIRMRGPVVRLVEGAFYENFIETAGSGDAGTRRSRRLRPTTPVDSLVLRSSPTGGSNDLKRLYLLGDRVGTPHDRHHARRTSSPTNRATGRCRMRCSRGVKIRILVEGDKTDAMPVKYASREAYERLLAMGIEIYEYQPTMMHTKTLVVDGAWSMFGSANFDNRSLELNDELNVAVADRELAATVHRGFRAGPSRRVRALNSPAGASARCSRRRARSSGRISVKSSNQLPAVQLPASSFQPPASS